MRKPRDYAADLKALNDRARRLKERQTRELGELVIATGADALPVEQLAGALIAATRSENFVAKEEWRALGEGFFRGTSRKGSNGDRDHTGSAASPPGDAPSAAGQASTN